MDRSRATALLFLVLAAIFAAAVREDRGATPRPATAPAAAFSAARALAAASAVIDDAPHPVGSPAHAQVRDRLAAHLRGMGYEVEIQRTFACNPYVVCAPVENVIARTPGDERPDALIIVAHYDSVGAGAGASDDGAGVAAVMETARALRGERFRNPIAYLLTDSEEAGLIGAEAFVGDPRFSRGAAAVINVEARGTSGASYMFETSPHNEWLIRIVGRVLPRPATSSLFYSIYERLPNDTDMTVFKRAGIAGVNFGNIGGVARYHTPLDDLHHVTPSTVQHHGEHVLAMARGLAGADLRQTSDQNAVWFDVLSLFVLWWPQRWSLAAAILALLILLVVVVVRFRDRALPGGGATLGVISFFVSFIATFLIAIGVNWLAGLRAQGELFVAQPGPAIAAMWLIGLAVPIVIASRLHDASGFDGLFLGHAICWCAVAIVVAFVLPGAAYLAVVPAMSCAILAVLRASLGMGEAVVAILAAAVAAVVFFPLTIGFYDAIGRPALPLVAAAVTLVTTTFSPFVAGIVALRRALVSAFLAAAVVCVAMANLVPPYSKESPRHISLRYFDDGAPRWLADAVRPPMARAEEFDRVSRPLFEWLKTPSRLFAAPAPQLGLPAPELRVISDERGPGRTLKLHIRSRRGAQRIALAFRAPSFQSIRVNGLTPPARPERFREFLGPGWHQMTVRGEPEAEVEIALRKNEAIDAVVLDSTFGLPREGAALAKARDESLAVPTHDGDTTTVLRRMRL